jgi:hypothetical protein
LANGLDVKCVETIDLSTSKHNQTNMTCHYQKRFLIFLLKPKCLTLWIYDLDVISFHFVKLIIVKTTFLGIDQNGKDCL